MERQGRLLTDEEIADFTMRGDRRFDRVILYTDMSDSFIVYDIEGYAGSGTFRQQTGIVLEGRDDLEDGLRKVTIRIKFGPEAEFPARLFGRVEFGKKFQTLSQMSTQKVLEKNISFPGCEKQYVSSIVRYLNDEIKQHAIPQRVSKYEKMAMLMSGTVYDNILYQVKAMPHEDYIFQRRIIRYGKIHYAAVIQLDFGLISLGVQSFFKGRRDQRFQETSGQHP